MSISLLQPLVGLPLAFLDTEPTRASAVSGHRPPRAGGRADDTPAFRENDGAAGGMADVAGRRAARTGRPDGIAPGDGARVAAAARTGRGPGAAQAGDDGIPRCQPAPHPAD